MATYNSDVVNSGVVPGTAAGTVRRVIGSVSIASNTSFGTTDTLPLFTLSGPSMHITDFWIDFPALDGGTTLGMSLVDSLGTATTIIASSTTPRAGGILDITASAHATVGKAVTYTANGLLKLTVNTASTNTTGASATVIYFGVEIQQD